MSSRIYFKKFNTLGQNGRHLADDISKGIALNGNIGISISISLIFIPNGPINNILASIQIMAWNLPGDKPSVEPMMASFLTSLGLNNLRCTCIFYNFSILNLRSQLKSHLADSFMQHIPCNSCWWSSDISSQDIETPVLSLFSRFTFTSSIKYPFNNMLPPSMCGFSTHNNICLVFSISSDDLIYISSMCIQYAPPR